MPLRHRRNQRSWKFMVDLLGSPTRRSQGYDLKRFLGSVRDALFKVSFEPTHLVGHVCEAKH